MKVIDQLEGTWLQQESILTIGAFDGVHRGHQALVRQVVEAARSTGRQSGVVTFYPHPANVLAPEQAVRYITTPGEKAAILERFGLDILVLIQFTRELANQSADQFIETLIEHLRPAQIWIGQDFALGRNREGDATTLRALGQHWGFDVRVVEPVVWNGSIVSSSRIRQLLADGEMEQVAELLGRYYALAGEVVTGQKRGRRLGFPTANLEVRSERALPCDGVYACFALLGKDRFPAVANLGVRPTFDAGEHVLEVHLLDVDVDLYGCDLVVEFVKWLRPELKFESASKLIEQMQADVARARQLLRQVRPLQFDVAFADWRWLKITMKGTDASAGFVEIEHVADRAVKVWASDLNGLFEQAARAMFALMTDLDTIVPMQRHEVTLDVEDQESALIAWLNELLFWRETRGELYSQFSVSLEGNTLNAWFAGQSAQPAGAVVKAATFHDLQLQHDEHGIWKATIVFDT